MTFCSSCFPYSPCSSSPFSNLSRQSIPGHLRLYHLKFINNITNFHQLHPQVKMVDTTKAETSRKVDKRADKRYHHHKAFTSTCARTNLHATRIARLEAALKEVQTENSKTKATLASVKAKFESLQRQIDRHQAGLHHLADSSEKLRDNIGE